MLKDNQFLLDIHRNDNHIGAEVAVIITSLIILYPFVLMINYCFTGRWGIFSKTASARGAEKLDQDFTALIKEGEEAAPIWVNGDRF